jgi:hypothetical protein
MQVVAASEKSSGRVIFLPRLVGTLRLWSTSETHSVRLVVAKIQYLDQRRPMGSRTLGRKCRRNQRSSFRELMGYPRLSPVDETATAFGSR